MDNLIDIDNKKQPPISNPQPTPVENRTTIPENIAPMFPPKTPQLTDGQHKPLTNLPEHGIYNPIQFSLVVKYLKRGFTMEETGNQLGVSKQAISQFCQREEYNHEGLNAYRDNKTDILENKQRIMVEALTPKRIQKMSDSSTLVGIGILDDKIDRARDKQPKEDDSWGTISKQWDTAKDILAHADPKDLPAIDVPVNSQSIDISKDS